MYDVIIKTLRLKTDDTIPVPAWMAKMAFAPKDWARRSLPTLPMSNWMFSADYIDEISSGKVAPAGSLGYKDLNIMPTKVRGFLSRPRPWFRVWVLCGCALLAGVHAVWHACASPRHARLNPSRLDPHPEQVTEGLPIEPVRHFRVGGYAWGDMSNVAKDVPESIRKYYNRE